MNFRRLAIGLLLLGALVGGWFAWDAYNTPKAPSLSDVDLDGVDKVAADVVREALDAIRQDPQSGPAWGKLGMVLQAHGFSEYISRCYEEAERLEANNRSWPYLHGIHLMEVNPNLGIPRLQKALALNPSPEEQAAIRYRLASVLIEEGHLDSGEEQLKVLRQLDPKDPRVSFGSGVLALARGDRNRARTELSSLTENPFIQKRACNLLASLVDEKQSRILKERALQMPLDRPWPDPLEERMKSYKVDRMDRFQPFRSMQAQGKHQDAFNILRALAAESPDREACYLLGLEHMKRNEYEAAEIMLRTAIRHEPTNVKTHVLLALSLLQRGEQKLLQSEGKLAALELFRRALVAADDALALQKESSDALLIRGPALHRLGRTDEAIQALRQAVIIKPESPDSYLQLGITLAEAGQIEDGIAQLEIAVQFASANDPKPNAMLQQWRKKAKTPKSEK